MTNVPANGASPAAQAFTKLVGRPRTVLALSGDLAGAAEVARARGAVVDEGAPKHERYDLVLPEAPRGDRRAVEAELGRWAAVLDDGGHLLVTLPAGPQGGAWNAESAAGLLEAAGLEQLRVEAHPSPYVRAVKALHAWVSKTEAPAPLTQRVLVARKPPRPGKLSLTIGMLTLNEESSVDKMIDDIRAVAPDAKILLIDSSSDQTAERGMAKGARVVKQLPPRGHGPAMERLMYEAASESDALIYIDCDFTYPVASIPRIRELLEEGADVVNANRTHHYPKAMPIPNFIGNRLFAATAKVVHGIPTTDVHSGMRGYRASLIRAFDFDGEGDALPLDTLVLPAKSNYHVTEFPIDYFERAGTPKLAKFRGTAWTFIRILGEVGEGKRVTRGERYRHLKG